jgi:E3 ubiquitin-protein ligase UBR2
LTSSYFSQHFQVESQRDFLVWTIKKYKDQHAKKQETPEEAPMPSSSYENDTQMETEQAVKEKRAKLAAQRREQLLAQMAKAQKSFITSNAEHFQDEDEKAEESSMEWQSSVEEQKTAACIGADRKIIHNESESFTCILCSEESSNNKSCMVYPAFVQKSSVLGRYQVTNDVNQLQSLETAIHPSPYVSSCGHQMHAACWKEYFNNELLKEQRRPFRTRNPSIFNIDKNQFLCPLCRFLSNTVLPIVPPLSSLGDVKCKSVTDAFTFDLWHQLMVNYIDSLQFLESDMEQSTLRDELQKNYRDCVIGFLKEHCSFDEDSNAELPLNLNPNINEYSEKFVENVKEVAPPTGTENNDVDSYTTTWQTCAYTIEALEMYMRATEKPLKGEMSVRHEKSVSGLVRLCGYYGRMNIETLKEKETPALTSSYYSLLIYARELFDNLFGRKPDMSILHWDVFSMMVSMLFTTRSVLFPQNPQYLIPRGDSLDFTIFETMYAVNLMKILLTVKLEDDVEDMECEVELTSEEISMLSMYEKFNIYRKSEQPETHRSKTKKLLVEALREQSRTFLRCSCILFHFLTEVPMPDEMSFLDGDAFDVMAAYLNVENNVLHYFRESPMLKFLLQCAEHKAVESYRNKQQAGDQHLNPIVPATASVRQLVSLPDDYSDLMNSVSLFTCRNNEREDSRNPTMCLVCGEVLCSQTYCCQRELNKQPVGACNFHTEVCGAGAGIYLRIRDAEVLLLGQNTGCFLSAPYLDDYGETDQGLRRGNPLHLCRESYKKLQLLWLGHGIHEDIARKTEAQSHIFQIQWNHL